MTKLHAWKNLGAWPYLCVAVGALGAIVGILAWSPWSLLAVPLCIGLFLFGALQGA